MKRKTREIANESMVLMFDSDGRLMDICNRKNGHSCLNAPCDIRGPFEVWSNMSQPFEIVSYPGFGADRPTPPAAIAQRVFRAESNTKAEFHHEGERSLTIRYTDSAGVWRAELSATMLDAAARLGLTITNVSRQPQEMMGVFPFLGGVGLGKCQNNLMVVNDEAGYIRPLWAESAGGGRHPESGGVYGCGLQVSMQWGCVFDETSGDALGFVIEDADLRNKEFAYDKPTLQVRYFPPRTVAPGESFPFPTVQILAYEGDWKRTAEAYHDWYTSAVDIPPLPDWARNLASYRGRWTFKHGQENMEDKRAVELLGVHMNSFEELPLLFEREPSDAIELCFFSRSSMGENVTGKRFCHMDGDNTVREDLGGPEGLREGVRRVHEMGHRVTLYVEGYIASTDADFILTGPGRDWIVQNKDGTNQGPYSGTGTLHMCPGAKGWQDHLARTCAELVRTTDVDGIRLDSLGGYCFPCYNPKHEHESPFDYMHWLDELLAKVSQAVLAVKPDCLLLTETTSDIVRRHFHGSLSQAVNESFVAVSRDVPPMRVALPEYCVLLHRPHSPITASLAGYTGGCPDQGDPHMAKLETQWLAARKSIAEIFRWGNASHDNPKTTRDDVITRRFSLPGSDVIIGARCRHPKSEGLEGYFAINANIDLQSDNVDYDLFLKDMPSEPASATLRDILSGSERPAVCEQGRFHIDSNWFVLKINYWDK